MGGGLVGASLAACLGRDSSLRIAVVEKFDVATTPLESLTQSHPSFDARNTALTNGTCYVFDQLGIWQRLRPQAEPIETILISDRGGFGSSVIRAQDERVRALGYVIENRFVGAELLRLLDEKENIDFIAPAEVQSLEYLAEGGVLVGIKNGKAAESETRFLSASLFVVADGALSAGRELLGVASVQRPYQQTAIVTTVQPKQNHANTAYERFTSQGPLALLPQTQGRFGVTWCVASDRADALMAMDDEEFLAALTEVAGTTPGPLLKVGQRARYPLQLIVAKEQIRPHAVILGNAAHSLHPVAGQGFNLSLRDVVVLAQVLANGKQQHRGLGDFSVLQQYLAQRESDQWKTMQFSHQLVDWFARDQSGIRIARNTGLTLFDWMGGAKRFVARQAMGRAVDMRLPSV